jgi:hypothetical protein
MSEQEYDLNTEAGRLAAVASTTDAARLAVDAAVVGVTNFTENEDEKVYAVASLVRKLGAELKSIGYEVTAIKAPKQVREPKVSSIGKGRRTA